MKKLSYIMVLLLFSLAGCIGSEETVSKKVDFSQSDKTSHYYTSAFPTQDIHKVLNRAQNSIARIVSAG